MTRTKSVRGCTPLILPKTSKNDAYKAPFCCLCGDNGSRKDEQSEDGISEPSEPSRFRCPLSERNEERGKEKGAAFAPNSLFFGSLCAAARSAGEAAT